MSSVACLQDCEAAASWVAAICPWTQQQVQELCYQQVARNPRLDMYVRREGAQTVEGLEVLQGGFG